ncbi:hypothetical protein MAUB1S_06379 [Mycolicibacterium aubagnense]
MTIAPDYFEFYEKEIEPTGIYLKSFVRILFDRAFYALKNSDDPSAADFSTSAEKIVSEQSYDEKSYGMLRDKFADYGDEETLNPPYKQYYYAMPMLVALSYVKYMSNDDKNQAILLCDQYQSIVQALFAETNDNDLYENDISEIKENIGGSPANSTFQKFLEFVGEQE